MTIADPARVGQNDRPLEEKQMPSPPTVWCEDFVVHSYEIDARSRARVKTITNFIQESAGRHAAALGASLETLHAESRTWMLVRLTLKMSVWPRWRDKVRLETWPSSAESVIATRDFEFFDANDERIGVATSAWMVVDMKRRRAVRLPESVLNLELSPRPRALVDEFAKLPKPTKGLAAKDYRLRRAEVDINLHANQSAYIDWAIDAVPDETWLHKRLADLEITFISEVRQGEEIRSVASEIEAGLFLHRLTRRSDGRDLARLRTRWVAS